MMKKLFVVALCGVMLAELLPVVAGAPYPQEVVQSGQGLDEQISPLVGKLITSSNEEEEGLLQVEVQVTVRQDRNLQPTLM